MNDNKSKPPKPKLNQLEMLVAVVDAGGFGAAAAQLGCTQSRISHAIGELEAALSARLLKRSRSGCTATDAGLRVVATARHMLRLAEELQSDAAPPEELTGHIRIACFRSVATHLLPPALHTLAKKYPALRVDIDDAHEEREDVETAVREGHADIGIAQLTAGADLIAYDFAADDYVLVAPQAMRLTAPLTWEQLASVDYLQLNCSGALAVLDECRARGLPLQPARLLATDSSIVAMVRQGLGYSILPRLAIYPEPANVRVYPLPLAAARSFVAVALPAMARSEVGKRVIKALRDRTLLAGSEAVRAGLARL